MIVDVHVIQEKGRSGMVGPGRVGRDGSVGSCRSGNRQFPTGGGGGGGDMRAIPKK